MGPLWYKEAIIYEVHVKCFFDQSGDGYGDFKGLTEKLDYLQDLGVTAIWLLPFYPSPLKDDGYDIADYENVHPQYGDLRDFKEFLKEAHRRGLKVIIELVINHTSDQHPWFQRARDAPAGSPERDFYVWSDIQEKYKDARIIFQDFEPSNWSWDRKAGLYYWHRFYSHQPDLNFENPAVHRALFQKMSFWLKMGVDGLRLDAIPYLYEKEGTNCENLPETHHFLKALRSYVDLHFEEKMLLAEANQWPEDAATYFGEGDECHMAFHFPVMPRLFMAIHLEDSLPIIEIMEQTPPIPSNCQWALFLRNHDELTLEMVTDEERDYMFRVYANDPQARLNLGIRRRLAPLLKNDRRKIELMNVLLFSLSGTPVLYYGDELGMGDNIYLGDRNGVRTPMQWSSDRNAGFSRANPQQLYLPPIIDPEYHYETVNVEAQLNNPHSLLWWTKQLIALRKRLKAFSYGTTQFLPVANRKVLVFFREHENELLMIIANLSRHPQFVELDLKHYAGSSLVEIFSGERFPSIGELPYFLTLGPYGYYWFSLERQPQQRLLEQIHQFREKQVTELLLEGDPEKLFHGAHSRLLEMSVRKYLFKRSWFQPLLRNLDRTKIKVSDHALISSTKEGKVHLVFVELMLTTGVLHHVPLFLTIYQGENAKELLDTTPEQVVASLPHAKNPSLVYDLSGDSSLSPLLLGWIDQQKKGRTEKGEIRGVRLSELQEGEVKIFKLMEEGMDLDVQVRLFLTQQTTFSSFLPLLGYVQYTNSDQKVFTLAEHVAAPKHSYLAKELVVAAVDRFLTQMETLPGNPLKLPESAHSFLTFASEAPTSPLYPLLEEFPEVAHLLGETTAAFHLAMGHSSTEPDFSPIPFNFFYQRSLYQTVRRKMTEAFSLLSTLQAGKEEPFQKEIKELIARRSQMLHFLQALPYQKWRAKRIRIHGDYTVDNLSYKGNEFDLLHFEENPRYTYSERRYKRSPLVDIASMLLSFAIGAFAAVDKLKTRGQIGNSHVFASQAAALDWTLQSGAAFVSAYLAKMEGSEMLPAKKEEIDFLLHVFIIEKGMENLIGRDKDTLEATVYFLNNWLRLYG